MGHQLLQRVLGVWERFPVCGSINISRGESYYKRDYEMQGE